VSDRGSAHRRAIVALVLVTSFVLVVDQISKAWAVAVMAPRMASGGGRVPLLGDFLTLTYYENPGASFGFASGFTWILTGIAVIVVLVIIRVSARLSSLPWAIAFGALLGGALGNLMDRLFRPPSFGMGHVIDFLAFGSWFVNNIADIAISVAAVMMLVLAFRGVDVEGERRRDADDESVDINASPQS
jgi:signal peptidase II